jgi:hypothetical protein
MENDPRNWKKFGLFSCASRPEGPFLNFEILWTPRIKARLQSHAWLDGTGWEDFVNNAQIGDVFNGKGIILLVRLRETAEDFDDVE